MKNLFFFSSLLLVFHCHAQQVLTLDDCIAIGLDRNIQLKQARNNELIAEANRFQAIMNFFPSLSAAINYDYYFGNFFDQSAARQVSETTNSSQPNISTGVVLFNGFSNHYLLGQRKNELASAKENRKSAMLDVHSNLLASYLAVVLDKENLEMSKRRVELLESQLQREKKRESVGVGNMESVYNFQGQLANEKLTANNLKNQLASDKLSLLQAMALDPYGDPYEIAQMDILESELLFELGAFDEVLDQAFENNPVLNSARYQLDAAKYQYKSAKAQFYPTISAFGRVGSNYSSNGARNPETGEVERGAGFMDQMRYNEFEYLNISMSIPIFSRYQTVNRKQVAKVNMANAELGVEQAMMDITNLIQQAYLDLNNAQNTYLSATENLAAATQSFLFMTKRFEAGNTDFYTYLESLNNKDRAQLELVNAKYAIVFRKKILDLYTNTQSE